MFRSRAFAGVLTTAVATGAVLAGPAALDSVRDPTWGAQSDGGVSQAHREQAANVVRAWRMNGPYAECIAEGGYGTILWQSTIALAEGLVDDPALAAIHEDIAASEGDDDPEWNTQEFSYASNDCRRQHPEQRPPPQFDQIEDWATILAEAREHGWSPDDPFALDCESPREVTLAPCRLSTTGDPSGSAADRARSRR
jgi:hypothetical protein